MKLAIISGGSKSSKMIAKEAKKYFDVKEINLKDVHVETSSEGVIVYDGDEEIKDYDCIYCRGSFKHALLLRTVTTALQDVSYMPIAPEAFTVGHDKLLTLLYLNKHKVDIPKTFIAATTEIAKKIIKKIHFPAILKVPSGTHGKGVMFADSLSSANSLLDSLESFNQPYIIQEYVETGATDIRAIVAGDKVVGSMKRKAEKGELRANIHAGASGENIILDYDTQQNAIKAAKAVDADICAVDILQGVKSVVIEINMSPGLQGITEITKKNVALEIAKYLAEKTKEFNKNKKSEKYGEVLEELQIKKTTKNEIVMNLDIKAGVIKLPDLVTKSSDFKPGEEVLIKVDEGKVVIKRQNGD